MCKSKSGFCLDMFLKHVKLSLLMLQIDRVLQDGPAVMTPCDDPVAAAVMMTRAASALIIISWILMLSGSIISCTACCCGQVRMNVAVA